MLFQKGAKFLVPARRLLLEDNIADNAPAAGAIFWRNDRRMTHPCMLFQGSFNLSQLDAQPSDPAFLVGAPQRFNISIRKIAPHVSCAVQTVIGCPSEPAF